MATEELLPFGHDLATFLRRVLAGYVYVTLTAPLWLKTLGLMHDFAAALAVLVIAGIVVGSVIYDAYSGVFWSLAWHSDCLADCWGLDFVKTLKDGVGHDVRHRKAVWDDVFFRNKDEVQKRIVDMFGAAHGSATAGIAILLSMVTWLIFQWPCVASKWVVVLVLALVAGLLALNHRRLCRDAGALENLFLKELWSDIGTASKQLDIRPPKVTSEGIQN